MASDLKHGSFVIADIDSIDSNHGDVYNRVNAGGRPALDAVRITFPGTAGAELRVIGNQNSPENSFRLKYGSSNGSPSYIIKSSMSDMLTFLASIDTYRLNEDNLIATVTDSDTTYENMYWSSFSTTDIRIFNTGENPSSDHHIVFFESEFIRITV